MSALDAIGGRALAHPVSGEVIEYDDLDGIKRALTETEDYLRRPEVRRMWNARDRLQERLVELDPIALPRPSQQTDKQRRVERCPRCKSYLPSEPEPSPEPEAQVGANPVRGADSLDAAGPASSGSESLAQTELLPEGPKTAEQEAALGVDIFGAKLDKPEPSSPAQEAASTDAPFPKEGAVPSGAAPSSPLDPVVVQAGAVKIVRGSAAGKTVAEVVEEEPERCLRYLEVGKDENLKAAMTTYMYATRPDLMKEAQ